MSEQKEELPALPEDLFLDEPLPTVQDLVHNKGLQREQAREVLTALRTAQEADLEASLSPDEHLSKLINDPLKAEIQRITASNIQLTKDLVEAGPMSERTPQEIESLIAENTKQLLNIKKTLAETTKASNAGGNQTNLTIDIGSIFQEALSGAREVAI